MMNTEQVKLINTTLLQLLQVQSSEEARSLLQQHPELLTDEADALLGFYIEAAREQCNEEAVQLLNSHREGLQLIRSRLQESPQPATPEPDSEPFDFLKTALLQFVQAKTPEETTSILQQHPELLTDEADALFDPYIEKAREHGDKKAVEFFSSHRETLQRFRSRRQEFSQPATTEQKMDSAPFGLTTTLQKLIQAKTPEEALNVLQQHPELLTDAEADALLGLYIEKHRQQGDEEAVQLISSLRDWLQTLRSEMWQQDNNIPAQFKTDIIQPKAASISSGVQDLSWTSN
jgi:2-oxo-4-hydroxy-4-carboxy--5-ureidoimidazoline (OHCU) decarboxylase